MPLSIELQDFATRAATESKAIRTLINGNAADLSSLTTTAKGNLVAALNELQAEITALSGSAAGISDTTTATTTTWSSQKTSDTIAAAINALVGGAPDALNTLDELAAALNDDANALGAVTTALANRVRVDAAQTFTEPQKAQARSNIGAVAASDIGDPNVDLVAIFEAGL